MESDDDQIEDAAPYARPKNPMGEARSRFFWLGLCLAIGIALTLVFMNKLVKEENHYKEAQASLGYAHTATPPAEGQPANTSAAPTRSAPPR